MVLLLFSSIFSSFGRFVVIWVRSFQDALYYVFRGSCKALFLSFTLSSGCCVGDCCVLLRCSSRMEDGFGRVKEALLEDAKTDVQWLQQGSSVEDLEALGIGLRRYSCEELVAAVSAAPITCSSLCLDPWMVNGRSPGFGVADHGRPIAGNSDGDNRVLWLATE